MSFQKNVEQKIKDAITAGEFDNLTGKGKPLDLRAYFATPDHLRMGYSILKSADIVPEEIELLREIESLRKSLEFSTAGMEEKHFDSNSLRNLQVSISGWNTIGISVQATDKAG